MSPVRASLLLPALLVASAVAEAPEHESNASGAVERRLPTILGDKVEDFDDYPMCGFSKIHLQEDPVRRFCLRQCRLEENGQIRPTFEEWEQYCRETSAMNLWDEDCKDYLACTFGCDAWGGDRQGFLNMDPQTRYEHLMETKADMYASGITKEQRCVLEKCHAYCAKRQLNSCREAQYRQQCQLGDPDSYKCDVDCNGAGRPGPARILLALAATASAAAAAAGLL